MPVKLFASSLSSMGPSLPLDPVPIVTLPAPEIRPETTKALLAAGVPTFFSVVVKPLVAVIALASVTPVEALA